MKHWCLLQCADPGTAVPKILPMLLTESAVTEDTTAHTADPREFIEAQGGKKCPAKKLMEKLRGIISFSLMLR